MSLTTAEFARLHGPDANVFTITGVDVVIIDDVTDAPDAPRVGVVLELVHRDTGQSFRQLYQCSHELGLRIATEVGVHATVIATGAFREDHPSDPDL